MALPLEEARSQLITVNAAIQNIISGKRIAELRIGSGDFQRTLRYQEVTFDELKILQQELLITVDAYAPAVAVFRTNTHIPMIVGKDIF
jgi:hypothetical protein